MDGLVRLVRLGGSVGWFSGLVGYMLRCVYVKVEWVGGRWDGWVDFGGWLEKGIVMKGTANHFGVQAVSRQGAFSVKCCFICGYVGPAGQEQRGIANSVDIKVILLRPNYAVSLVTYDRKQNA